MKKEIIATGWNSRFTLRTTRIRSRLIGVLAMAVILINPYLPSHFHALAFLILCVHLFLIWRDAKELEETSNEIEFKAMTIAKMLRSYWIALGSSLIVLPVLMIVYRFSGTELVYITLLLVAFLLIMMGFDFWRYRKEL